MDSKQGNGSTSPFGNGRGGDSEGGASGAVDLVKDPKAMATAPAGGMDVTRQSRAQPMGGNGANPDSIPEGGPSPFPKTDVAADASTSTVAQPKTPFKLSGGG